jgi:hypothetical protein
MTFLELYGTKLDRELGSSDRTTLFTTALRKEYVNEGQKEFARRSGCFVRRASIAITDEVAEYDAESTSVITAGDYLRPSLTSASLKRYDGSGSDPSDDSYIEGDEGFPYRSEEWLNAHRPNWRSESYGTPECWTLRNDGGSQYIVLVPGPSVPSGETWTLLWPYVADPADMSLDADEPWSVSANPRTTLRPYHTAVLYWAAAQCEKLRKNLEGEEKQLKAFAAELARYRGDTAPPRGTQMRMRTNYYRRQGDVSRMDPRRWP